MRFLQFLLASNSAAQSRQQNAVFLSLLAAATVNSKLTASLLVLLNTTKMKDMLMAGP